MTPGVSPAKFYIFSSSETTQTNTCNFSSVYTSRQPDTFLADNVLEHQILRRRKKNLGVDTELDLNYVFGG